MKLFGQLVRTVVNVALVPVAVVKDVATIGGACTDQRTPYTAQQLEQLKRDALED